MADARGEARQEYNRIYKQIYYAKNREKLIQQSIDWAKKNPDRAKDNFRRSYENNRERRFQQGRDWIKENIDAHREYQRSYTAARRAKIKCVQVGEIDYEEIHARCAGICNICDKPIAGKFEYDHIIPVARGGPHTTENLQITHPSCNRRKNSKLNFKIKDID